MLPIPATHYLLIRDTVLDAVAENAEIKHNMLSLNFFPTSGITLFQSAVHIIVCQMALQNFQGS